MTRSDPEQNDNCAQKRNVSSFKHQIKNSSDALNGCHLHYTVDRCWRNPSWHMHRKNTCQYLTLSDYLLQIPHSTRNNKSIPYLWGYQYHRQWILLHTLLCIQMTTWERVFFCASCPCSPCLKHKIKQQCWFGVFIESSCKAAIYSSVWVFLSLYGYVSYTLSNQSTTWQCCGLAGWKDGAQPSHCGSHGLIPALPLQSFLEYGNRCAVHWYRVHTCSPERRASKISE